MKSVLITSNSHLSIGTIDIFDNLSLNGLGSEATSDLSILNDLTLMIKPPIVVMGKECHQQRDVGFFSDSSQGYAYSNQIMRSQPLTPELSRVLNSVNAYFSSEEDKQSNFNGILINRYNSGQDYIGAHSDDEKGLAPCGVVAISLGATRIFRIRAKKEGIAYQIDNENKMSVKKGERVLDLPLTNNSVVWMAGQFQQEFTHEIPKELKVKEPRLSLTFRSHKY